jgi:hypothetical protein
MPRETIQGLLEVAARPVLEVMPERAPVDHLYQPNVTDEEIRAHGTMSEDPADLVAEVERHTEWASVLERTPFGDFGELNDVGLRVFSLVLRGSIRAALSGVFAGEPHTLDIRGYSDGAAALVWCWRHDGAASFRGSEFAAFPELILDMLPTVADGVSETVRITSDDEGVVDEGQDDKIGSVLEFLARKRAGTIVVDLVAFGGLCAEFPEHGFVIVDNDLGRHVLAAAKIDGQRELVLAKLSRRALSGWLRRNVETGRTGL